MPEEFDVTTANVYDIYFEKDEQRIQPNCAVKVYIPVPSDMDGGRCKVFHIDESGNVTDMDAVYENGYMAFTTEHFSYYALVEERMGFICILGDSDNDGIINSDDAVYLLGHTLFAEYYPLNQSCDFNGDGEINSDDATYLLGFTLFPDYYPLH